MTGMPDDDLFSDSTMTFGEHLEDLRRALFRACAGLVVALLVSVFVADDVVRWIEQPLRKGLRAFYLKKAKHDLATAGGELSSLEDWEILEKLEWSPKIMRISRAQLLHAIGSGPIGADTQAALEPLSATDAATICLAWSNAKPDSANGVIWSLLTESERAGCQDADADQSQWVR
ncbi:MAG: twin-arginine translocase subunit TatC [Planctomycetota bacterium]